MASRRAASTAWINRRRCCRVRWAALTPSCPARSARRDRAQACSTMGSRSARSPTSTCSAATTSRPGFSSRPPMIASCGSARCSTTPAPCRYRSLAAVSAPSSRRVTLPLAGAWSSIPRRTSSIPRWPAPARASPCSPTGATPSPGPGARRFSTVSSSAIRSANWRSGPP